MTLKKIFSIITSLLFIPLFCFADMIVGPIMFFTWPTLWPITIVLIALISLIEAPVFSALVYKKLGTAFIKSFIINLISTFLGFLLSSILMIISISYFYSFLTKNETFYIFLILLFLICFILTFLIEACLLKIFSKNTAWKLVIKTSLIANIVSYGLILLLSLIFIFFFPQFVSQFF